MIVFSNARLQAVINDWPLGGDKRGTCTFTVETKEGKGSRIIKQTTGKPKATTYSSKVAIVDGDNGRTYLLGLSHFSECITISRSTDFKNATTEEVGIYASVFSSQPEYNALKQLIDQANTTPIGS